MEGLDKSGWKFDENVVPVFDEHVKQSVPMYDEIHRQIAEMGAWFLEDKTNVYDIGTSTGKVISNLIETYPKKDVEIFGLDNSKEMVNKTKSTFKDNSNINIELVDLVTDDYDITNASLITSVLTLQFISQRHRKRIAKRIYEGLNEGGAFVLVEKVIGKNAKFNEMWVDMYHEMKIRNGLSEEHVFKKAQAIRGVMRPITLEENIKMLESVGFKDTDVFFKWNNFVGIVGIK